jgi:2-keto-4-pentenoate hydratase/2-oxohepta-3-ene-1,7-dioic acid hydratase in catechol pathway
MNTNRRRFLKTTGFAGVAALAGTGALSGATPAEAQIAPKATSRPPEMPKAMTFCTLRQGDSYGLGLKTEKGILDIAAAAHALKENAPTSIDAVFKGEGDLGALKHLAEKAKAAAQTANFFIPEKDAKFGPAVTNPEKIVCIGLNYRKHAAETGQPVPKLPILFNKFNNALNTHKGKIKLPVEVANKFDYETELVIVIGKEARNVSEADASGHIAGFATGNDFSARDLQLETGGQWMIGKTVDGFGPLGPYLVTADQVDGDNLKLETWVNGELRQNSNTNDMVFNTRYLVSYISRYFVLRPGDIIYTGTPEGVIQGKPADKRVWLKAGDKVVSSLEKLGKLEFELV